MTLGTRIVVMKDGVIQQVDSPQNLYDRPDNLFVAGFIGSPQMNFIDATVVKEGGELFLEYGEHHRVILPPEKAAKLTDYIGKEVTFGIRPEDVLQRTNTKLPMNIIQWKQVCVYLRCWVQKYSCI